ncbi:MAG: ABC transporter substrate-binding protein, partial [Thermoleophilia bacterium]|nr:ABC transporter substrate-binding protein [Thermoleophilia bacterium]
DFSELARTIAAADPDAVGYAGFNPDAALFYRQLRDVGYGGAFGSFDAAASASEFVAPLGEIAEGVYFSGCAIELPEDFRSAFSEIHGGPPAAAFNGQYADAVRVLLDAVAVSATQNPDDSLTIDRAELRDAVRATTITDGRTGAISFDANGDRASERAEPADQASDFGLIGCQVEGSELVQIQGQ